MNKKPVITFAVIAYNAEPFIREAVEGALAQTYEPLQIILSDDASLDSTFEIMKQMIQAYSGPHMIQLNRNNCNLGIGAHVNRIMELALGEYVVIAAGDDVSLPERTQRVYEVFREPEGRAMAVFSDHEEIDENGNSKGVVSNAPPEHFSDPIQLCRHLFRGITGATNAWHREVFDAFGPMLDSITFEDRVIAFRASLLGDVRHIPEPLVRYRRHGMNTVAMFHSGGSEQMPRRMQCFREVYRNNKGDLLTYARTCDRQGKDIARCQSIMNRRIRKFDAYLHILSGEPLRMILGLLSLTANGGSPLHGVRQCLSVFHQWQSTKRRFHTSMQASTPKNMDKLASAKPLNQ